MTNLMVIFTILCPLFFIIGREFRPAQEMFFEVIGLMTVFACIFLTRAKDKLSLWIGIFGVYVTFLFFLSRLYAGANVLLNIVTGIFLYFIAKNLDSKKIYLFFKAIIWVCIINLIWVFLQTINLDPLFLLRDADGGYRTDVMDTVGFMGIKVAMGMYMAIGLIAALYVTPLFSISLLFPIYLCQSTGVILGLMAGSLFWLYNLKRKLFYILVPLILIAGVSYFWFVDRPTGRVSARPVMWRGVMQLAFRGFWCGDQEIQSPYLQTPVTGYGLDSFRFGALMFFEDFQKQTLLVGVKFRDGKVLDFQQRPFTFKDGISYSPDGVRLNFWDNPHCEYIQVFWELGILGFIIIGMILYYLFMRFKGCIKNRENVTLVAIMIAFLGFSTVQFPFHLARIGYLFPIMLGLFAGNTEKEMQ